MNYQAMAGGAKDSMLSKVVPLLNKTAQTDGKMPQQYSKIDYTRSSQFQNVSSSNSERKESCSQNQDDESSSFADYQEPHNKSSMPTAQKEFISSNLKYI